MSRPSANPQGNASGRPGADLEPIDHAEPFEAPPAPAVLSEVAASVWLAVWNAGREAYNLKTDSYAIERYSEMQARRAKLLGELDEEGWTTTGSTGNLVAHPAAKLLDSVDGKLLALEDRLGLSPESRLRLGIATVEKESKLRDFLNATS